MAAHRYWRLKINSTNNPGAGWTALGELRGYAVGFADNQLLSSLGVVASASSTYGTVTPANANDNNLATTWATNTFVAGTWLAFDLGVGVTKDFYMVTICADQGGLITSNPASCDWQWSDDNVNWTTAFSFTAPGFTKATDFYTAPTGLATPSERLDSVRVLAAATVSSLATRVGQAPVLTAVNFPSPFARTGQLQGLVTVTPGNQARVVEAAVLVAVRGRTSNPKLRAWTFTLDGHDFYVLRLGTMGTLVYDVYSQQWMDWDAFGEIYWPVTCGFNWVDGQGVLSDSGDPYGSNVLVGDDTFPLLYFLDPNQPYDENPELLDPQVERYFTRVLQGQVIQTGREVTPCYAVWLTADMGAPAYVGAGVKLEISDDAGKTYDDMGTVDVTLDVNTPELSWYSLGQIGAPGRLFRISDDGAVARIDNMEMNDPDDNGKK